MFILCIMQAHKRANGFIAADYNSAHYGRLATEAVEIYTEYVARGIAPEFNMRRFA